MDKLTLTEYYDYLSRVANSKCRSQFDAEDLVSETILSALAFIKRGGVIEYPKTWLANTLMHKYADLQRRRAGCGSVISLDLIDFSSDDDLVEYASHDDLAERQLEYEEAAEVRRELNYLAKLTREVLMRYYVRGESVDYIASALGIPSGTVKSRLDRGRQQVKKGLEAMETKKNHLPGRLNVSNSGSCGPKYEPMSLVEGDLIAENLLLLAYEKPLTPVELAERIGIPTVYIEPILDRLVGGELMVKTDSGRYYTDFIITYPETKAERFENQLAFANAHMSDFCEVTRRLIEKVRALAFVLDDRIYMKLERYAVLRALQNFQLFGLPELKSGSTKPPKRRDGGAWLATGNAFPADYRETELSRKIYDYSILGGHRTTNGETDNYKLWLYEFDTPMWDCTARYAGCFDYYFAHIHHLLWYTYNRQPIGNDIPNALIEAIPRLCECGVLRKEGDTVLPDIPILTENDYKSVTALCDAATSELTERVGEAYRVHIRENRIKLPSHLKSVPEQFTYVINGCIPMAVVRRLYDDGLHMAGVDYCCPPMVLMYKEK
ncbi:MAG: RNA polymerase sigma factor [Clostridia bacterium]|nr:RNA polymerase sigma factor [Clostridia bacterium]